MQLRGAWEQAQKGRSSLLLIQGEAGIGKTRLAEELADYARRQGMIAVHTRAYAAQGSAAYTPIVNLLRTERHFQALGTLDDTWLTELSRLLPELLRNRPDLPAPLPMTEAWQQRRFQEALARGFLAVGQPLLLHFDDLQWCDSESLAWLRFLFEYDRRAGLLVVGTVRDDEIDEMQQVNMLHYELQQRNRSLTIDLQPLGADDAARLANHVVGHTLTDDVAAKLFAETEGSPLFIVEMLRSGDYAAIPVEQDKQTADSKTSSAKERRLPPKIQAVIKWRLGQLSPPARQMAAEAAVLGRSFTYDLLTSASGSSLKRPCALLTSYGAGALFASKESLSTISATITSVKWLTTRSAPFGGVTCTARWRRRCRSSMPPSWTRLAPRSRPIMNRQE